MRWCTSEKVSGIQMSTRNIFSTWAPCARQHSSFFTQWNSQEVETIFLCVKKSDYLFKFHKLNKLLPHTLIPLALSLFISFILLAKFLKIVSKIQKKKMLQNFEKLLKDIKNSLKNLKLNSLKKNYLTYL